MRLAEVGRWIACFVITSGREYDMTEIQNMNLWLCILQGMCH